MFVHVALVGLWWHSFCTASIHDARPPGIVIRLKTSTLKFASDFGAEHYLADYIRDSLRGMNQTESCIFGSCSLQNCTVNDYVAPLSNVTFGPGNCIQWKFVGTELNIRFEFELNETEGDEATYVKGNASVRLSGSLEAEFKIEKGSDDRLNISLTKCLVDVRVINSNVSITEKSGNSSKFQGLFDGNQTELHDYLRNRLNASVSTAMYNMADIVARMIPDGLSRMNKELASSKGYTWDDTLVREPILQSDCIEVAFRAAFRMVGDDVGTSIQPPNFDISPEDTSMVSVYVSKYVINTLFDVLFKTNWFRFNITKEWLPRKYRSYGNLFNTSCEDAICFGTIFPSISQQYPNASVKYMISATSPPLVTFLWGSVVPFSQFDLSVLISEVNGSEVVVANLSMTIYLRLAVVLFSDKVVGAVDVGPIHLTDQGSSREFAPDLPRFNVLLQTIVDLIVLQKSDYYGAIGYPLYFPNGIRLVNTYITFNTGDPRSSKGGFSSSTGAFRIGADLVYDSSSSIKYDYFLHSLYSPLPHFHTVM